MFVCLVIAGTPNMPLVPEAQCHFRRFTCFVTFSWSSANLENVLFFAVSLPLHSQHHNLPEEGFEW